MIKKQQNNKHKREQGFVAILTAVLVIMVMVIIGVSVSSSIIAQQKITNIETKSLQAYFAADSGIEDAIFRIRTKLAIPDSYSFQLAGIPVNVQLSEPIGGARKITSQAENSGVFKKVEVVHTLNIAEVDFFFGAQVGDGGITMANGSMVLGNVFSNGTISGDGEVTESAVVAGVLNEINGINVGGDAKAHNCDSADIAGILYYVDGGAENCAAVGGKVVIYEPVEPIPLPISEEQIEIWRVYAADGGTYSGDYEVAVNESLGPIKIDGNLTIVIGKTLTITGTVWVAGNLTTNNNTTIQLDAAHGAGSGVIVVGQQDGSLGLVNLANNTAVLGSGQAGSYLMILTTSTADPAMILSNNSEAGVFYANQGYIQMNNNSFVKEVTSYGVRLANNAVIEYEIGLSNTFFKKGPGGVWKIESWSEVE